MGREEGVSQQRFSSQQSFRLPAARNPTPSDTKKSLVWDLPSPESNRLKPNRRKQTKDGFQGIQLGDFKKKAPPEVQNM